MRRTQISIEQQAEMRRVYRQGQYTHITLAEKFNTTRAVAGRIVDGIEKRAVNAERDAEICRLYRDTAANQTKIAAIMNMTQSNVSIVIRKNKVRKLANAMPCDFIPDDTDDAPRHPCRIRKSSRRVCAHGVNNECYLAGRCEAAARLAA